MMRAVRFPVWLPLAFLLFSAPAAQADPLTFKVTLFPANGEISGPPGSTVGWGYTVENDTDSWLDLYGIGADVISHATPDAGLFDFPIVAPGESFTALYDSKADLDLRRGLFQITWDVDAPVGFTAVGNFILSGFFWNLDPLGDSQDLALIGAADVVAPFSATVSDAKPVPEPASLLLISIGVSALAIRRRRHHARQ